MNRSYQQRQLLVLLFLFSLCGVVKSQAHYFGKVETGYAKFRHTLIDVEPGPNWKGYNLAQEQNGVVLNTINGLSLMDKKLFTGLGIGYLNFEGIHGLSIFSDIEYMPFKAKVTPLLNLKLGYSHIWNQYPGGTGTILSELAIGLNYRLTEAVGIYLKTGFLQTQQASFLPVTAGIRF